MCMLVKVGAAKTPRAAFTLVELLTVMTIIGTLTSLLLPAVNNAREAAARASSVNNLKQIGLAMQNFETAMRRFPTGYLSAPYVAGQPPPPGMDMGNTPDGICTYDAPPGWAWGAYLLPYMEQTGLYEHLNFNLPCTDPANAGAVAMSVKAYLCPWAPNNSPTMQVKQLNAVTQPIDPYNFRVMAIFGRSHYVANAGRQRSVGHEYSRLVEVARHRPVLSELAHAHRGRERRVELHGLRRRAHQLHR